VSQTRASLVAAFVLVLGSALFVPAPAHAGAALAVGLSFDSLTPYGHWMVSASYGRVWRPAHVYASWRPYWDGRWVDTDFGWTFVSDEPWAWATYHYGRWVLDPYFGWVWVPGDEWAPAWVDFYAGDGWIGWAPMPPTFGVRLRAPVRVDPRSYCFVDERHFLAPRVGRYAAPPGRNRALVRDTRFVSRVERDGGRWYNRGPSPRHLETVTRRQVPRLRVVGVDDPRRVVRGQVRGNEVVVYRPQPRLHGGRPTDVVRRPVLRGTSRPVPPQQLRQAPRAHDARALPSRRPPQKNGQGHGRH